MSGLDLDGYGPDGTHWRGSATTVLEPIVEEITQHGNPEVAHIYDTKVNPDMIEAMVMGLPITALCGAVFVPSRDPEIFPVCEGCLEIAKMRGEIDES